MFPGGNESINVFPVDCKEKWIDSAWKKGGEEKDEGIMLKITYLGNATREKRERRSSSNKE